MGLPVAAAAAAGASQAPSIYSIAAMQAAGGAANEAGKGIMGLALGGLFNKRAVKQQRRMNELQKEMTEWNMEKQLEMWEKTGYGATKEQMKRAGLNPALMYGMGGGGGGQTANIAQGGTVAAQAYQPEGMGMNLMLMKSQIEATNAQAEKTRAEAEKIKGIDTTAAQQGVEESKARVESLLQGVDNQRQQHELQKLEITLRNMQNYEQQTSQEDRLGYIMYQTRIAAKQWEVAENEAYISSKTRNEKVDIIRAEAIGAVLKNALTEASTGAVKKSTALTQEQINAQIQTIMRDWDKMSQENQKLSIQRLLSAEGTDDVQQATNTAVRAIGDIFKIIK